MKNELRITTNGEITIKFKLIEEGSKDDEVIIDSDIVENFKTSIKQLLEEEGMEEVEISNIELHHLREEI